MVLMARPGTEPVPVVEGIDITYRDFLENTNVVESEICQFFRGTKVFITGASGFMGKVLLEKLLRTCGEIETVYIMLRPKKGKSMEERFKEQFDGPLFESLRNLRPDFSRRVSAINGDCSLPNLGLSPEDLNIVRACNIVFHVAATVRFDEKIRLATAINVKATLDLLHLARQMPDLKSFVYVSTAYSNPQNKVIEEKFYQVPLDYKKLISVVDSLDDEILEKCTPALIQSWPNTYALTKSIAETAIRDLAKGLPVAMVRPSIVISTAKEPLVGWINNVYGPTGVVAGAGLGLLRTLYCNEALLADMVPVDMAINATVAASWDVARRRDERLNNESQEAEDADPMVYHFVSSVDNPIRWGEFMSLNSRGTSIPSMHNVWVYDFRLNRNYYVHMLYVAFLHLLPALIVDTALRIVGKKPFLWEAYRKIHKFSHVIAYFCTQEWTFKNDNTKDLLKRLNSTDKELFDFDIAKLGWDSYFLTYMRGLRTFLVHDPLDTLPEARKRYNRLLIVHNLIKWSIRFLILYLLVCIFKPLFTS